ncbi:MAG: cell division protein ZapA (FtsZ GTPase activity inhibitor) [Alteromonas naphthalenivorans]|jgi:cell division protein ZapA (FtsZ GTPase activity inhibitor)
MSKTKVQVTINDAEYSFVTDESEEHLHRAAARVDESVRNILRAGVDENVKAAVLSALQLASNLLKLEEKQQQQDAEKQRLVERIERESHLLSSLS